MLIHGNPRAEQTEPRIRSARFGIGRDETEHRPTLLGRTEIETEHPLAPRDESEQYSISVRSVRSQACRLVRKQSPSNGYLRSSEMQKVSLKNIKQELLFGDSHKFGDLILTKPSHLLSESNQSELFSPWQQLMTF